jgi:hypothetical protein
LQELVISGWRFILCLEIVRPIEWILPKIKIKIKIKNIKNSCCHAFALVVCLFQFSWNKLWVSKNKIKYGFCQWQSGKVTPRGCLYLEAKIRSPKKRSILIGGNKRYPVFGYKPRNKWAHDLVFFCGWKVYMESKVVYMNSDFLAPRVSFCCYLPKVAILEHLELKWGDFFSHWSKI